VAIIIRWLAQVNALSFLSISTSATRITLGLLFLLGIAYFEFFNIGAGNPYWKSLIDTSVWGISLIAWNQFLRGWSK
jgi:hypothetical protein